MQQIGEEQIFQTLFCELKLEDERVAPGFSAVWNGAQVRKYPLQPGYNLLVPASTAFLVVGLISLALWLSVRPTTTQFIGVSSARVSPIVNGSPIDTNPAPVQVDTKGRVDRANSMHSVNRLAKRTYLRTPALPELDFRTLEGLSMWQSPTAILMQSPADDVLTSFPQLYQSVNEFYSFLADSQ